LPDVVGESGLLVSPFDEWALAVALKRVLTDQDFAAALRTAGQEQAMKFSWRTMALQTLRCYDEIANGARPCQQ
jgi:glycosyltransferase involved in cell wall biosynthesis